MRWWAGHKGEVAAAAPCGDGRHAACPDCRASGSCPRDVFYTAVARHAALCGQPALTKQTVKYKLFSTPGKKDRRVEQWTRNHPELAGYMAWMVVEWERDNGGARFAAKYIPQIPAWAIEEFASRDSVVLDPFSGSGTTLVEAIGRCHQSYGVDCDALACLMAAAKTTGVRRRIPQRSADL